MPIPLAYDYDYDYDDYILPKEKVDEIITSPGRARTAEKIAAEVLAAAGRTEMSRSVRNESQPTFISAQSRQDVSLAPSREEEKEVFRRDDTLVRS